MKKFLSAALALCLAFSLAACGGFGSSTPASTAPSGGTAGSGAAIKIGGIGPVTGSTAVYGNAVKNGAEIAIAEINALGGQCCFSKRMRKVFRKNEKSMLQNYNKKAKRKGRLQRVKKPM